MFEKFKEFILEEQEHDFDLRLEIERSKNEVELTKLIPDNFNDLKKKFDKDWENRFLFDELRHDTNYLDIAKQFISVQPLYYDKSKLWWIWNSKDKKWELTDEVDLMNAIDKYTRIPNVKSHVKNEMLEALRRVGRSYKTQKIKPTWVQFKDNIIDIKTNKKYKAEPRFFVTNPIPWNVGKETDTPEMDRIFTEWVGPDYVKTLYQIIAYSLLPSYPLNRLFCFMGEGLNGKSKYLELITNFVGLPNTTSTELDSLLNSRFEITRLHKKLVCQMGETNFAEMSKTAILKKLTGGDVIGFEYKNKDPFDDYNYAKILISTNNLPATTDKTIGFYRRWLIIDFPNRFNEKRNVLESIPEKEYENLALKCIELLQELMVVREFHNEGTVEDRMKKFEDKSNPFDKFMRENVNEEIDSFIFKYEFKQKLNDWCKDNRFRTMSDTFISKKMGEMGSVTIKAKTEWYSSDGEKKRYNAWSGVGWKENIDNTKEMSRVSTLSEVNNSDKNDKNTERYIKKSRVSRVSTLSPLSLPIGGVSGTPLTGLTGLTGKELECRDCGLKTNDLINILCIICRKDMEEKNG